MVIPKWARYIMGTILVVLSIWALIGDLFLLGILLSGFSKGMALLILLLGGSLLLGISLIPIGIMYGGYMWGINRAQGSITKSRAWSNFILCSIGGVILAQIIEYVTGLLVGFIAYH